MIQKALETCEIKPGPMAIFGDRNSDILAGKSMGMTSYLLLTGYGAQEKETTQADFIVKDLSEAVDHFLGLL